MEIFICCNTRVPAQPCTLCTASLRWCERRNLWLWGWIKRRGCAFLIGDRIWAGGQASLWGIGWSFMERGDPLRVAGMRPKIALVLLHTIQTVPWVRLELRPQHFCVWERYLYVNSNSGKSNGVKRYILKNLGICTKTQFGGKKKK